MSFHRLASAIFTENHLRLLNKACLLSVQHVLLGAGELLELSSELGTSKLGTSKLCTTDSTRVQNLLGASDAELLLSGELCTADTGELGTADTTVLVLAVDCNLAGADGTGNPDVTILGLVKSQGFSIGKLLDVGGTQVDWNFDRGILLDLLVGHGHISVLVVQNVDGLGDLLGDRDADGHLAGHRHSAGLFHGHGHADLVHAFHGYGYGHLHLLGHVAVDGHWDRDLNVVRLLNWNGHLHFNGNRTFDGHVVRLGHGNLGVEWNGALDDLLNRDVDNLLLNLRVRTIDNDFLVSGSVNVDRHVHNNLVRLWYRNFNWVINPVRLGHGHVNKLLNGNRNVHGHGYHLLDRAWHINGHRHLSGNLVRSVNHDSVGASDLDRDRNGNVLGHRDGHLHLDVVGLRHGDGHIDVNRDGAGNIDVNLHALNAGLHLRNVLRIILRLDHGLECKPANRVVVAAATARGDAVCCAAASACGGGEARGAEVEASGRVARGVVEARGVAKARVRRGGKRRGGKLCSDGSGGALTSICCYCLCVGGGLT